VLTEENRSELKRRILEEMTVNYSAKLEKNFELAKHFVRLTPEGTVDVLVREKLPGKEQILLYLIGKMYAKEAGYVTDENVGNDELLQQLGFPTGSLLPFLKELRDENLVRQVKRENHVYHAVPSVKVEEILNKIESKLAKNGRISLQRAPVEHSRRGPTQKIKKPHAKAETSLVLQRLHEALLPDGYFKEPRNTREVRAELESRFHIKFLSRKVSQALGDLHNRGVLSRVGSKGNFRYVISA